MLRNKNAIITGTNRGIGKAILRKFAENGCNIWACARKKNEEFENEIEEIAKINNVQITPIYFDLSSEESIKEGFKQIYIKRRPIEILVNNAGIGHSALFQMTTNSKIREVFEINTFAVMEITQLALKSMTRQKHGSIINISSIAGLDSYAAHCAYAASKAAIISFSKSLATELALQGIRVNSIAPGATDTDMIPIFEEKANGNLLKNAAMNRYAKPEEIAEVVLFLASDKASFINGQVIRVDGGSK